ncbi:transmembrane anterior posterior transformation protein 1 homolog [Trichonephila clavipes]|uniref:Transmembrane anterior posterior transformation protein 1 homolog n=1 Tax=Trichonephila clavipes TaxID=2585209 RepID=A0A8X6R7F0_TRICX|nr:transmembrane anterior posterior transformation protein 1 homolog [Trichonephila clavipes]
MLCLSFFYSRKTQRWENVVKGPKSEGVVDPKSGERRLVSLLLSGIRGRKSTPKGDSSRCVWRKQTAMSVADKLFSSFGQDILDALYWTATVPRGRKREHFGLLPHLCISLVYVFIHSLIVLIQATTLNVAINSQNKALQLCFQIILLD